MKKILTTIGIIIIGFLGWLFTTKPVPPFGATMDVALEWKYSYSIDKFDTISGDLEPGTYVYAPINGAIPAFYDGDYYMNDNGVFGRSKIKPKGFTEVHIVGEKAFSVFQDPDTSDIQKYEITKAEYDALGVQGAGPATKTITKVVTLWDMFKIPTAFAAISRHCTIPADNTGTGTGCQYTNSLNAASLTFAYDTGSNANRVLIVTQGTPGNPANATYNGTNMTKTLNFALQVAWNTVWTMTTPSTGSNNVVVYGGTGWFIDALAVSYDYASGIGDTGTYSGTSCTPTITDLTTTADGSWVLDHEQSNTQSAPTAAAGQTELWVHNSTGAQYTGVGDKLIPTSGTNYQPSWTLTNPVYCQSDYGALEITAAAVTESAKPRRIIINQEL